MMTARYIENTEVAKIVRQVLKAQFPGTKFTVKTSKYAGGSSIHIAHTDGPALENVEHYVENFHGASFDGMQDLKEYRGAQKLGNELVEFGNDYIFTERHYGEKVYQDYAEFHNSFWGDSKVEYIPGEQNKWGYISGYISGNFEATRRMWEYLGNTGIEATA